jgi:hypothetical protein
MRKNLREAHAGMLAVMLVMVLTMVSGTSANAFTLTDRNSAVTIDPGSSTGMSSWVVDGVSQVYEQGFWYRIGTTGAEHAIGSTLAMTQARSNEATVRYNLGTFFTIDVKYALEGGIPGSTVSNMTEVITVTALQSGKSLGLFQYSDFDLGGAKNQDVLTINGGTVSQKNVVNPANWESATSVTASAGSLTWLAGENSVILAGLNDNLKTWTTALNGPTSAGGTSGANVNWAFESWNTYQRGATVTITETMHIEDRVTVPEPTTLLLLGLGLIGLRTTKRRFLKH